MKVLLINGSPNVHGNTAFALDQMIDVFHTNNVETELIQVGSKYIRGCIACRKCHSIGKCVFDDLVNQVSPILAQADGVIIGSPVYYAAPNGTLISFLDRLFYSNTADLTMKVGASIVCARRGGCTATMDVLNKYFSISSMPIAASTYWNQIHGGAPGEAAMDPEGIRTMRNLAKNMVFLMEAIARERNSSGLPEKETPVFTNFVR